MGRAIVFAADLQKVVATTSLHPGIRWAHPGDRDRLIAAGADASWFDRETGNGSLFVVAEEEGRIIGYSCHPTRESMLQYSWLVLKVRPGLDVFSVGGFVIPEKRGQRIRGDMKRFAARHFIDRGYQRMISVVDGKNTPSIRSNTSVGSFALTTLTKVRLGKLILVWHGRAFPHVCSRKRPFVLNA